MKLHNEYGQSWFLAAGLIDGPRTLHQLEEYYRIVARRFGLFMEVMGNHPSGLNASDLREHIKQDLQDLISRGWIVEKGEQYAVTELGREQAELMLKDLERSGHLLEKASDPQTVSKVTLLVHFVLAAVKMPAALLSGSVGLLNDALDTLMDGISSLFVFFGVRSGRERQASYILLVFMGITGLYSLYEAISRFIHPVSLQGDIGTFIAVSISAGLCALLWVYQKFSGLRHSCIPLIAQSIDSRNHIIVAGGVAAGLIAAKFDIILLDQIVGMVVAVLILKGAVELLIDLLRSSDDEDLDLSKYGFQRLDRHRHRQFVRWFLFEIEKGNITTRRQMFEEAQAATDFNKIASLRALGLHEQIGRDQKIETAAKEVFEKNLAVETPSSDTPSLHLTPAGKEELHKALNGTWDLSFGRFSSLGVRFLVSSLFFSAIYAAARWGIRLLNKLIVPLETYSPGPAESAGPTSSVGPGSVSSAGSVGPASSVGPEGFGWLDQADFLSNSFNTLSVGPFSFTPVQAASFLIGLLLFYHGRMLSHRAAHAIRHAREKIPDANGRNRHSQKPRYLITRGPFALRRHPMYTGHILITLGFGIALHSVYALAWSALAAAVQLIGAFREERHLRTWFPREYPHYSRQVKHRFLSLPLWFIIGLTYTAAWIGVLF